MTRWPRVVAFHDQDFDGNAIEWVTAGVRGGIVPLITRAPAILRKAMLVLAFVSALAGLPAQAGTTHPFYREAQTLLSQGRPDAALAELAAWRPADAGERAQRLWAMSSILRAQGRGTEALPLLEELVALRPDVPAFRLALAEVLHAAGQEDRAWFHLDRARAGLESGNRDVAAPVARPLKTWSGQARIAIVPETNPANRTEAETIMIAGLPAVLAPGARSQPATGLAFGLSGAWQPQIAAGWSARLGADLQGEVYDRAAQDEVRLTLDAGVLRHLPSGARIDAAFTWSETRIDTQDYSQGPGLRVSAILPMGADSVLSVAGAVQDLAHPGRPGLDGLRSTLYLGHARAVAPNLVLRGGLRVERTSTPTPSVSNTARTLHLGAGHVWRGGLSVDLDLTRRWADHDGRAAIFPVVREDRRDAVSLRVLHTRLSRQGFAPVLTLTAERQSSSLPIHAYDTFGVSLGLTRNF